MISLLLRHKGPEGSHVPLRAFIFPRSLRLPLGSRPPRPRAGYPALDSSVPSGKSVGEFLPPPQVPLWTPGLVENRPALLRRRRPGTQRRRWVRARRAVECTVARHLDPPSPRRPNPAGPRTRRLRGARGGVDLCGGSLTQDTRPPALTPSRRQALGAQRSGLTAAGADPACRGGRRRTD